MFDLAKAISTTAEKKAEKEEVYGCSLFYQTQECHDLIEEVFRFEGWPEPVCENHLRQSFSLPSKGIRSGGEPAELEKMVILELNRSSDVVEDARRFASRFPNRKGVIVVGNEDAISTLRSLKEMGFYYLFWPVTRQDLGDFIRHVRGDLKRFTGVSQNRKAKSVAVVGTKGGVGATLLSAELSAVLAHGGADTVMVNHNYLETNIDVILGLKNFQKQGSQSLEFQINDLDEETAPGYLNTVNKHLKLLALDGQEQPGTLREYSHAICDLLTRQAHFIVEDYSASVDMPLDVRTLVDRNDIVVLVTEPTISSVRTTANIIDAIRGMQTPNTAETRVVLCVNLHRPDSAFPLSCKEVEDHLALKADVVVPFDKRYSARLLAGKRLFKSESGKVKPFTDVARIVNGQSAAPRSRTEMFRDRTGVLLNRSGQNRFRSSNVGKLLRFDKS